MNLLSKLMCSTLVSVLLGAPLVTTAQAAEKPKATTASAQSGGPVITFNRLLRPKGKRHLAPTEDPLRDPANQADNEMLQPPMDIYPSLPPNATGNGNSVDWVKAVDQKKILPRWDRLDPSAEPMVMDMSVVRVTKGKIPNVVFPHRQHTLILDCSNCHPDIFIPQKGANQISMAAIILGQKCGVCHGKVAFPITECRLCHSQPKELAGAAK